MKNVLFVGLFLFLFTACGEKTNVYINGTILDADRTTVYLEKIDVGNKMIVDSVKLDRQGQFSFKLNSPLPNFYTLHFGDKEKINLIVRPNDKIKIKGTLDQLSKNYTIDGSNDALWIKSLDIQLHQTNTIADSLRKAYQALSPMPENDGRRQELNQAWEELLKKQILYTRDFISKNGTSLAAYYALYQKIGNNMFIMDEFLDLHYFKVVASALSAFYPELQYTKAIMGHLQRINQKIKNQQLLTAFQQTEGSLPNICLPNVKGDTICLNDVKSKYIILEFNLITPPQTQEYLNELKRIYAKFKNRGVEIYQVCLDNNKLLWEEVVEKNKINWVCVRDAEALRSRKAATWNVQSIPANYIINDKKEIVGKNLSGKRLEDRLNDLLKR